METGALVEYAVMPSAQEFAYQRISTLIIWYLEGFGSFKQGCNIARKVVQYGHGYGAW